MLHFERESPGQRDTDVQQHTNTIMTPKITTCKSMTQRLGEHLATSISKRISKLQYMEKMRVIKNVLHNLYGRHNPIDHKPQFNFQESWQTQTKDNGINKFEVFSNQNHLYMGLYSLLCFLFAFSVWFFSVYRLFGIDDLYVPFLTLVFTSTLLDGALKQSMTFQTLSQNNLSLLTLSFKDYLNLHWKGLVVMCYLGLLVMQETLLNYRYKCFFCMDLYLVWITYQRFKDLYDSVKIKILGSKFRNQIMIFQLFGGCILLVHIFGLLLFLVSLSNPVQNWTNSIPTFSQSWFARYIHSLYFACTTALTVGYGDVTPVNLVQIIIVMLVQVVGIINMGYIVNEIGRILSKISQSQELLYKNISQAEKVTQNYQLPSPLATKMKTYIINNQIASDELNIEEEDHFMRRLNDQIRDEVNNHNHLRIVKTSVFFLCQWSKKFQQNIATKLIRSIYSPQETLPQMQGHQKIYILTRGKISIEASRDKLSNLNRKTVQTIVFDPSKDVQFNTYGYSALVTGLNINLKAVAKEYSICYHVEKQDILNTIIENESDFHYFHQMKSRIQQSRFKQIWEAPNISNTREHYMPNAYYIIQKNRNYLEKTTRLHTRHYVIRSNYRSKWYILASQEPSEQDLDSDPENSVPTMSNLPSFRNDNVVLTAKERQEKYKAMQNGQRAQFLVTNRKYRRKLPRKLEPELQNVPDDNSKIKTSVLEKFEQFKNFKAYLPKYNFNRISELYHQKFGIKMDTTSCKSGFTKAFDKLGEDLVSKLVSFHKIGTAQSNI